MRKIVLTAMATAAILSGGMLGSEAGAMPLATPAVLNAAAGSLVRQAAVVCGGNGCAPVQTGRVQRRKFHP